MCKLFNKSLSTGTVPQEWKETNIVPGFKKGEAEYTENYSLISLLPPVSKVLEGCVLNRNKDRLPEVIKVCQHGFLHGKSCTSILLEVLFHIGALLDRGGKVNMVYMDMSKAFDKVCHYRLLRKLRKFGFGRNLLIIPYGPPTTCHREWRNIRAIAHLFLSSTGIHPWPGSVSRVRKRPSGCGRGE